MNYYVNAYVDELLHERLYWWIMIWAVYVEVIWWLYDVAIKWWIIMGSLSLKLYVDVV